MSPAPAGGAVAVYANSYVGARYYRPDLGRFTTVDPGHVNGDTGDPQSWSPYASVRNNPLRYMDPTGTAYWIQVPAGHSFPVDFESLDELRAYVDGFSIEGGIFSGIIKNRAGDEVATYTYFRSENGTPSGHCDPFCQMVLEAGNRADAGLKASGVFMAGAATVGATGGLAVGVLSGGLAAGGATTLGVGGTPVVFKTMHYASRLVAAGVSVVKAEAAVRGAMAMGQRGGELVVDGVKLIWRSYAYNGQLYVGTIHVKW